MLQPCAPGCPLRRLLISNTALAWCGTLVVFNLMLLASERSLMDVFGSIWESS